LCGVNESAAAVFAFIAVLISKLRVCAQAQPLQGRFYPEADSYIVGEPVLFNLEIKNTGSEDVNLHAKNPSGRLDTYAFSVQRTNSPACGANWNAECAMRRLH
jgi:hypothetical protein